MGEEKQEKGKIIDFWTWFEKRYESFQNILEEDKKKKKKRLFDDYYYEILRYPPNSNPPRLNKEQLKLIFNKEIEDVV